MVHPRRFSLPFFSLQLGFSGLRIPPRFQAVAFQHLSYFSPSSRMTLRASPFFCLRAAAGFFDFVDISGRHFSVVNHLHATLSVSNQLETIYIFPLFFFL